MASNSSIRVSPVLLALALAGCSDAVEPLLKCGIAGTADANVNGAVTASVDGCSTYGVSVGASPSTAIVLAGGNLSTPTHTITLARNGARPATGSYTVSATAGSNISGAFVLDGGSAADRTFILTAGTIDITTSSAGTLRGTFNSVTAKEGVGAAAPTVTITGNFSAKCVDTADNDC